MSSDQTDFRIALLDAATPVPDGLLNGHGGPAGKRFSVYRNNVAVSLTEALRTGFPVLEKLLGQATFARLAGIFLRAHPPTSPLMMHYGADMPAFLSGFEPLRHIGYLPDVARLELALRQSYHAADHLPVAPERLAELSETTRMAFAPSLVCVRSSWPLWDIWAFNTQENAAKPRHTEQDVLITRPEFDPAPHALSKAEGAWITCLARGGTLGTALDAATQIDPAFDMTPPLTLLVKAGAIRDLIAQEGPKDDHSVSSA